MKIVLALALLSSATASFFSNNTEWQKQMFSSFVSEYRREYASAEAEAHAFTNFVAFLKLIDERNAREAAAGGSAVHGITRFADLSQAEFEARYLLTNAELESARGLRPHRVGGLPEPAVGKSADWTGTYTTPVKDQGYCGSCWAHSVAEQLESDSMRTLGTDYILSPQQLTSCDTNDMGCNGGWPTNAYDWIEANGGLVQEKDYPYTSGSGSTGTCDASKESDPVVTLTKYYQLASESDMASHALSTGPIAIAVDASQWNSYTGGVLSSCGTSVDHAVQIVGVNTGLGYWKVRNSWGTSWGESGYIRLEYGSDMCALTTIPTYVDAAAASS